MANNQNQSGGQSGGKSGGQSGGKSGGQSGGQSARSDVGQGDVKNPDTDGRLKENGGGQQNRGQGGSEGGSQGGSQGRR